MGIRSTLHLIIVVRNGSNHRGKHGLPVPITHLIQNGNAPAIVDGRIDCPSIDSIFSLA